MKYIYKVSRDPVELVELEVTKETAKRVYFKETLWHRERELYEAKVYLVEGSRGFYSLTALGAIEKSEVIALRQIRTAQALLEKNEAICSELHKLRVAYQLIKAGE